MNHAEIKQQLHDLVFAFVAERAYKDLFLMSPTSQGILVQMQSSLVNAHHIWGDIESTQDKAVRKLSITICMSNLQTFIEAASAARELYLILPNHLVDYQDRADRISKLLAQALEAA